MSTSKYPHIDRNGKRIQVCDRVRFKDYYGYRNQGRIESDGVVHSFQNGTIYIDIPTPYRNYGRDGDAYDVKRHGFHCDFRFYPDVYVTSRDKGSMEVLNVWVEVIS